MQDGNGVKLVDEAGGIRDLLALQQKCLCSCQQRQNGFEEKDIEGGESISELIRKNIQECSEFLVLLSRYSIDRPWVLIEIGAAWVLGKRIVAIIDKVSPEEMPDVIASYKALDLNSVDEYLRQLVNRVKKMGEKA